MGGYSPAPAYHPQVFSLWWLIFHPSFAPVPGHLHLSLWCSVGIIKNDYNDRGKKNKTLLFAYFEVLSNSKLQENVAKENN